MIPPGTFSSDAISFRNFGMTGVNGHFNNDLEGENLFSFYGGDGRINYSFSGNTDQASLSFSFRLENVDLSGFAASLNKDVYVSGRMDIEGSGNFSEGVRALEISFRSRRTRGVKQVMNFGAVKAISSLGGGNPVKAVGGSNFGYSLIAGRVTIRNEFLTVEGACRGEGGHAVYSQKRPFWRHQPVSRQEDKYHKDRRPCQYPQQTFRISTFPLTVWHIFLFRPEYWVWPLASRVFPVEERILAAYAQGYPVSNLHVFPQYLHLHYCLSRGIHYPVVHPVVCGDAYR